MIPRSLLAGPAFAALVTLTFPAALFAQSLSITDPGHAGFKLFDATAGFTITGLAAAPGGDVFYIESDSAFTASSRLLRRGAGDGYAAATSLFDFGAAVFGSFVRWESGKVFFGENSTGAIRAVNPDLSIDALGTVVANYDGAFSGGSLFVSHNPGGAPANKVSRFDLVPDGGGGLMLAAADLIMNTPDDYSGPVEFAAGALYYGGSGIPNVFGHPDLHRFTAAEVAAAAGAGPTLALDPAHLYFANGTNAYLAADGTGALWQTNFGSLNLIDTAVPGSTAIGTSTDYIGQLDVADGRLFANVTNAAFNHSSVYQVVPEPAASVLLGLGLAALTLRRRRKD